MLSWEASKTDDPFEFDITFRLIDQDSLCKIVSNVNREELAFLMRQIKKMLSDEEPEIFGSFGKSEEKE